MYKKSLSISTRNKKRVALQHSSEFRAMHKINTNSNWRTPKHTHTHRTEPNRTTAKETAEINLIGNTCSTNTRNYTALQSVCFAHSRYGIQVNPKRNYTLNERSGFLYFDDQNKCLLRIWYNKIDAIFDFAIQNEKEIVFGHFDAVSIW